jgi:hypothetical protein
VFWRVSDVLLRGHGQLLAEFRTEADRYRRRAYERHYCAYPSADQICREVERAGGIVVERVEDTGLAPYDREDPFVCRLLVDWTR